MSTAIPRLRTQARAKINLCLLLGPMREDGYHEVMTVILPVELADSVSIGPSEAQADEVVCPGVEGENLVRDGEVEAVKIFSAEKLEGAREVVGVDFETEVAPVREAGVGDGERGEGGVVHRRADRVLDRVPEDGERGAGKTPAVEVGEREDGGTFDGRFQNFDRFGGGRSGQTGLTRTRGCGSLRNRR